MTKLPILSLFKIVLEKKTSFRFLVGTIASFAFSMSVILCTIGLMDGFEITLKKTLAYSNGDIRMTSKRGFFLSQDELHHKVVNIDGVVNYSPVLQIESFATSDVKSNGVLVKGVKVSEFIKITKLKLDNLSDGIAIGSQLAKLHNLKVGDYVTLAMASSNSKNLGTAILNDFQVQEIVQHGVYEKDFRYVYMDKKRLEKILSYKEGTSNLAVIKIQYLENIEEMLGKLGRKVDVEFVFAPYWSEFEVLLDAVQIEKASISMILQLIVLVAILNIVAFMIYISEMKSRDFFMLRALGLSFKELKKFWYILLLGIWLVSCIVCYFLKDLFAYLISVIPALKIPGDIYVLSELNIILDVYDYLTVYCISLVWIFLIGFFILKKLNKGSVISGLRQEFS